ncbi:uncharacterized protein Z518_09859 [Rhinocladiella mackenziei CBS 650.93]|uniref:Tryptophan synthase beta chain-like PALP domain-containing protein n=1 Tax=Rhinocladiella mackenziei CBS 650.93 TaxID=1442369 RepID=A0A0D2I4Q9_9EURO|nr:uncharacterized protein Z518_09859 [Rhinocladiella mackenziei CBS 650.93]KIX00794.1 hypothetical protein Z518_09859 [Rhinocladiella mackenziei CBS 650.93]
MSTSSIYTNPDAKSWIYTDNTDMAPIQAFHRRLQGYQETPLIPLPDLSKQLGVNTIFVKDESSRLSLPAFKILGASWGVVRAIIDLQTQNHTNSDPDPIPNSNSSLDEIASAAQKAGTILFAATEGNHGRAVARMGKLLSILVRIFMSKFADAWTIQKIEKEGASCGCDGSHDDAVAMAHRESQATPNNGLLVQDNAFENYEQIPAWTVEGYSTLLFEVEDQLARQGLKATAIVTPIGVGSLGHAAIAHCKSNRRYVKVLTVEPTTAACLYQNLQAGKWSPIPTSATIMNEMNCGTVSPISWPVFEKGVDAAITVSDAECHDAVQYLQRHGVNAGPCGAAALAALRKAAATDPEPAGLNNRDAVVVLLSTEGKRDYVVPTYDKY